MTAALRAAARAAGRFAVTEAGAARGFATGGSSGAGGGGNQGRYAGKWASLYPRLGANHNVDGARPTGMVIATMGKDIVLVGLGLIVLDGVINPPG